MLAELLGVDTAATSKAMPVTRDDGTVVLALVRGDDRLEEAELAAALGAATRASTVDEIRAAFGADPGSLGPVGFSGEVIADDTLREASSSPGRTARGGICGASRRAATSRLALPTSGFRRRVTGANCGGALSFQTAIEVGHIFKLGTTYSEPLGATFLDEDGQERVLQMGSYGIGPGRVLAAAVEQGHDDLGIRWPALIAPYDVHVVVLTAADEIGLQAAEALSATGAAVLLDDRPLRPGEKFADADLIGLPVRVTAGKKSLEDGAVDVKDRSSGAERRVQVSELGTGG